jgi:DNA repair protein RadC
MQVVNMVATATYLNKIKMETNIKLPPEHFAEIELVYKSHVNVANRPVILTSSDTYEIAKLCWDMNTIELVEHFKVLLLNCGNQVLGVYHLSIGTTTATLVDIRLLFTTAIKANAVSIILLHNHPSGNLLPSNADKNMTYKVVEAAKLLDVRVLDHLIITAEGYFSFADEGLL